MSLVVTVPTARLAEDLGELPEDVELHVWDMQTSAPAKHLDIGIRFGPQ